MIFQARTARPSIILNGRDYYSDLAPYFLSLTYTDNCDGTKADDLEIQLADRDKRFISDWMPDKGAFLDVSIIAERWFEPMAPAVSLDCGRLWIDSIEFQIPDNTASIKCTSLPSTAYIKRNETRGWEGSSLKDIAQQIAGESQMSLDYQSSINPRYSRVEQDEESALAFLKKLTSNASLSIKIHRNTVVIFDEKDYEAKPAQFNLIYGNAAVPSGAELLPVYGASSGQLTSRLVDITKKARVKHHNPDTGKVTDELFSCGDEDLLESMVDQSCEDPGYEPDDNSEDGDGEGAERLRAMQHLLGAGEDDGLIDFSLNSGSASGQRKAKSVVRNANKDMWTATIDLEIGNPLVAGGMTFNLVGVGKYDGKWFIVSAKHSLGPMFTTSLEIRRCLVGY